MKNLICVCFILLAGCGSSETTPTQIPEPVAQVATVQPTHPNLALVPLTSEIIQMVDNTRTCVLKNYSGAVRTDYPQQIVSVEGATFDQGGTEVWGCTDMTTIWIAKDRLALPNDWVLRHEVIHWLTGIEDHPQIFTTCIM